MVLIYFSLTLLRLYLKSYLQYFHSLSHVQKTSDVLLQEEITDFWDIVLNLTPIYMTQGACVLFRGVSVSFSEAMHHCAKHNSVISCISNMATLKNWWWLVYCVKKPLRSKVIASLCHFLFICQQHFSDSKMRQSSFVAKSSNRQCCQI